VRFGNIVVLALGLAMDATAVAAARGMALSRIRPRHVLTVAVLFGGFQALMPALGWLVGTHIGPLVEAWDHWLAFGLLGGIGLKMLWEARSGPHRDSDSGIDLEQRDRELFAPKVMIVLAVATSIDALAVGLTLPLLNAPFFLSLGTIGVTAGVLSALGLFAGRKFGAVLGPRLDIVGGLILIGLGLKILLEHLHVI